MLPTRENSCPKPIDHIDDLRSEVMFYRGALCAVLLALLGLSAALLVREVLR
jgi:hypothetical protein